MTNKFIPCQKYLWAMYGPKENPDNIKGNVRLLISIKGFPLEDWCFTGKLSGILEEVKRDIEAEKKAEEDKKARKA